MNPEIYLSTEEKAALSNSGDDAAKALYAQGVSNAITLESCKGLESSQQDSLLASIGADKFSITAPTKTALLAFLNECKKSPSQVTPHVTPPTLKRPEDKVEDHSQIITNAAARATAAMESKLGKLNDVNAKEFLGMWQRIYSKIPGTEPTDMNDIGDAINQSGEFNRRFTGALVFEYNQDTPVLPIGWFSNMPSFFPAILQKNHDFSREGYNGKFGVQAKREYILDVMKAMEAKWNQISIPMYSTQPTIPEMVVDVVGQMALWALPIFGASVILLSSGRVLHNMAHNGVRKPEFGEAIGWGTGKTWDGTKWVSRKVVAAGTFGVVRLKPSEKVKADKDTPAYSPEDWIKERARLEETIRRMIYMDKRINSTIVTNPTPAAIFTRVETETKLKKEFNKRMSKLNELGNTLVGKEKYFSKEIFDEEAAKIVAGELEKPGRVLRRIPGTKTREQYLKTQENLKKVKGEIDAMRARLSAKATMDGVEVPKALEKELQALEHAYKVAYEADISLDKTRNQIAQTTERINAINEVIAHFEEIDTLKDKITNSSDGIAKQIADLELEIATARNAAHSENPAEQRNREAEGKQAEIDAANRERDQAIREFDAHESAKQAALKEKKGADQAMQNEEARIHREIAERKTQLQDQITTNSGDTTKTTAIQEWQEEINGKRGRVQELNGQLLPPYANSSLQVKHQQIQDATNAYNDLVSRDTAVQRKIADAESNIRTLVSEKTAILSRPGGTDARATRSENRDSLNELKNQKSKIEGEIKELKSKIDALATKPENKGFPRSNTGTLAQARSELTRLEALMASGGTLDTAKATAKVVRDTAFTDMNKSIVALNTESARLSAGLDIKISPISEFVKGQGYSDDLSIRENGTTGEKSVDHKVGPKKSFIKTIFKKGHSS